MNFTSFLATIFILEQQNEPVHYNIIRNYMNVLCVEFIKFLAKIKIKRKKLYQCYVNNSIYGSKYNN